MSSVGCQLYCVHLNRHRVNVLTFEHCTSGDIPHLFINIEDYLYYNTGRRPNQKFRAVMAYFR